VLLPNRRAARGLMDAFAAKLGGAALLPSIRPIGDPALDDDPDVWGASPLDLETPPQIDPTRQRMELASLIRARDKAAGGVEDPARALALADELGKLMASAATVERVHWEKLRTLVTEIDLARHWEASAQFLDIVARYWPERLKADGLADPGARRAALLIALAREWEINPPDRPIIIAGSTGSIYATRVLMRAVAHLPRGVVVLPGLDVDLDDGAWNMIGDQHPQFALKETLAALGVDRRDVPPFADEPQNGRARRLLLREALAPAEQTADWLARLDAAGGAAFVASGAQGVRLLEAATEEEEAASIALLLREALETPARTAALVTPDVGLARRVESKLARWGVAPVISHGLPLRETEAGALIALLCELARDDSEPVALAALLKHPRVTLADDARGLATLEHEALRGPRRHRSLQELIDLDKLATRPRPRELAQNVAVALAPLSAMMAREQITLAEFTDALTQAAENAAPAIWRDADGENAADLLREAIAHGAELGAMPPWSAPRVLMELLNAREAPPPRGGDPRIAIWGPLEARLQRRDLMILGSLNEGVWPAPPGEDPFLSRAMRAQLGLPSQDQRIGLAAHDFAQLASAPEVVMTRSLRREGSPTLASRWLWRLKTLADGAGAKLDGAADAIAWAQALNAPQTQRAPRVPRPKPPTGQRLQRISVTQVETLIRDPYAVYARRILGFEFLKPIGAPAGHQERGTAVHRAIERFEDGADPALLHELLDEELRRAGIAPERRAAERERLGKSVAAIIAWFKDRAPLLDHVYRESKGELSVEGVTLSGVADRIEIGPGHAAILDYKTGKPPTLPQVQSGLSPQLPLEAAMLARGAFKHKVGDQEFAIPAAHTTELVHWWIGGADPAPIPLNFDANAEGEKALSALRGLLQRYAEAEQPFLSKPRVQFIKPYTEYDHLARRKEWADAEGEE
jgi:ATP-dependent helicase/nuclease subunit B